MNDSLEYAKMIEIPSTSCEYVYKRKRRFFKKKAVINKVNSDLGKDEPYKEKADVIVKDDSESSQDNFENADNGMKSKEACEICENRSPDDNLSKTGQKKEKVKSNIIKAQVVASFALAIAIVLTNIFWENSGMNTLFKTIFGIDKVEEEVPDERGPKDFSLVLPAATEGVQIDHGIISIQGEYSLYPVCEGVVKSVEKNSDGSFTVTIEHSNNFSSVTEGVDLVYFDKGDLVYQNVPIGYSAEKALVYLYSGESLVTDYAAVENSIVFNK